MHFSSKARQSTGKMLSNNAKTARREAVVPWTAIRKYCTALGKGASRRGKIHREQAKDGTE